MRWLDGIKSLNWQFWRLFPRHPQVCSFLALFVIAVMIRDAFLWACMGESYLDEPE